MDEPSIEHQSESERGQLKTQLLTLRDNEKIGIPERMAASHLVHVLDDLDPLGGDEYLWAEKTLKSSRNLPFNDLFPLSTELAGLRNHWDQSIPYLIGLSKDDTLRVDIHIAAANALGNVIDATRSDLTPQNTLIIETYIGLLKDPIPELSLRAALNLVSFCNSIAGSPSSPDHAARAALTQRVREAILQAASTETDPVRRIQFKTAEQNMSDPRFFAQ